MHLITVKPEEVFQALADRTRIRIMRLLVDTGEEICLYELVGSLQELQYKLSRHLKTLRQAGLLTTIKASRWLYHRLATGSPTRGPLYDLFARYPITMMSSRVILHDSASASACAKTAVAGWASRLLT